MSSIKYLVVTHPPVPKAAPNGAGSYTVAEPPNVQRITAESAEKAAHLSHVRPGGHCLVIREADVRRFERAEVAPLEERDAAGLPLPQAA